MADWTYATPRDEHLDEHNQYDHTDLASLTEGKVLGVSGGVIKQVDQTGGDTSPLTTKGDVAGYDSVDARIPVGSNDQVLTADSSVALGVKWAAAPGAGGGGMPVTVANGNVTVSAAGIWIVQSDGGVRTVTLPLISNTTTAGMRVVIKREGSNFVDVDCAGSDDFEPGGISTQRLFTNWSALSLVANTSANYWYELGYYGAIT
jgi:hypothetical protein